VRSFEEEEAEIKEHLANLLTAAGFAVLALVAESLGKAAIIYRRSGTLRLQPGQLGRRDQVGNRCMKVGRRFGSRSAGPQTATYRSATAQKPWAETPSAALNLLDMFWNATRAVSSMIASSLKCSRNREICSAPTRWLLSVMASA
jgi:hypothetical protein